MAARVLEVAWRGGYLRLEGGDDLVITASNSRITLAQREIVIEGLFMGLREYPLDRRGQRKVVYIDFAFPLKGLSGQPSLLIMDSGDYSVGRFGVSYTVIDGVEYYVTVYTPPEFLYENAVLSSERLAIFMLGRRQVYLSDEGKIKRILLV
ncbi:MAG: hypothetical protein GSR80_000141 [Desulfurococcales archaeon]|nr:hypothetical protein [Desulfurococcales archaeon]